MVIVAATANPATSPPDIRITGPEQLIASATTGPCGPGDIADSPLRAVRLANGDVVATATWRTNHVLRGRSLDHLTRDCKSVIAGAQNADPARFDDQIWLGAVWTDDGRTIDALAHHEYEAADHAGACTAKRRFDCSYLSILPLHSDDGGASFHRSGALPVAAPREKQSPAANGPRGFQAATNVVHDGGYRYFVSGALADGGQRPGACLFRATVNSGPEGWQYRTKDGWASSSFTPYGTSPPPPPCEPLAKIRGRPWSLLRRASDGTFLLLTSTASATPRHVDLQITSSSNLVDWSEPRSFTTIVAQWNPVCRVPKYNYPALIDPASKSPNFETVGSTALLFMTRIAMNRCQPTMKRDLVAIPVSLE